MWIRIQAMFYRTCFAWLTFRSHPRLSKAPSPSHSHPVSLQFLYSCLFGGKQTNAATHKCIAVLRQHFLPRNIYCTHTSCRFCKSHFQQSRSVLSPQRCPVSSPCSSCLAHELRLPILTPHNGAMHQSSSVEPSRIPHLTVLARLVLVFLSGSKHCSTPAHLIPAKRIANSTQLYHLRFIATLVTRW